MTTLATPAPSSSPASKPSLNVAVVGAGLGGLAAACTLAARGHAVTLFDKNSWLGGKAAQLVSDGEPGQRFRFDMGPTILTVPKVLGRVFEEAGRDMHDYLDLRRLDPQWRCFFDESAGGGVLDLREDTKAMVQTLKDFGARGDTAEKYPGFIAWTERLDKISDDFYFWKSIGGLKDMALAGGLGGAFSLNTLKDVLAMKMGSSVATQIRKHVDDERVAQMLDHFTQYVGSSPYGSPAILCGIASMQVNEGVWYPIGGTRAVPLALTKLAEELGVDLRPNTEVTRIHAEGGRATGVETAAGETVTFDRVVSNMDAVRTHRELIGGTIGHDFDEQRTYEPACSGVVLYLGLNKAYDHLAHHDFVFSRDAHEEFEYIYKKGEPAPDPTAYHRRHRADRGARRGGPRGRRGPVRAGAHALPAAAPRLVEGRTAVQELPPDHSGQAEAHRGHARPGRAHRVRKGVDAPGHPRPLPRAQRRDLRPGQPRQVDGGLQAGQPQPVGERACTWPAARPTPARACPW